MHVGLIVFFLAVVLWKKGSIEARCLVPVVITASLMEILDLRYDYVSLGYFRPKAITASIHDLINTMFWAGGHRSTGLDGQIEECAARINSEQRRAIVEIVIMDGQSGRTAVAPGLIGSCSSALTTVRYFRSRKCPSTRS